MSTNRPEEDWDLPPICPCPPPYETVRGLCETCGGVVPKDTPPPTPKCVQCGKTGCVALVEGVGHLHPTCAEAYVANLPFTKKRRVEGYVAVSKKTLTDMEILKVRDTRADLKSIKTHLLSNINRARLATAIRSLDIILEDDARGCP